MNKAEFKACWESDASGGGITFNDIANCAVAWGISKHPRAQPIMDVTYLVLKAADCNDAEDYK